MMQTNKLPSNTTPLFNPKDPNVYMGKIVPHNERAPDYIGAYDLYQNNRQSLVKLVQTGFGTYIYDELARYPLVQTSLNFLLRAAFWTPIRIVPRNDYTKTPWAKAYDDEIIGKLNEWYGKLLYDDIRHTLKNLAYGAMVRGFQLAERVWEHIDGYTVPIAFKNKKTWDFTPKVDQYSNLIAYKHVITGMDIEPEAFVIAIWGFRDGNYLGMSVIESIYEYILLHKELTESRAKGSSLMAVAPLAHHTDPNMRSGAEQQAVENAIDNMKSASILHLKAIYNPNTGKMEPLDTITMIADRASNIYSDIGQQQERIEKIINDHLSRPPDMTSFASGVGSNARAQSQIDMFMASVNELVEWVEFIYTDQIINWAIRYNWPSLPSGYLTPCARFEAIEDKFNMDKALWIEKLITNDILHINEAKDAQFVRETFGLPVLLTPESDMEIKETGAGGAPSVQDTALNGAQIDSLLKVLTENFTKSLSRGQAIQVLQRSFQLSEREAADMYDGRIQNQNLPQ